MFQSLILQQLAGNSSKPVNLMFQSLILQQLCEYEGYRAETSLTWFPRVDNTILTVKNLDICETRQLYVSKSNFANMKATELKLYSHGSEGWRIRIWHSKFGHLRNS